MAFLNAFGALGRFLVLGAVAAGAAGVMASGEARTVWLVIALSIGITGVTFTLVGSRLGRVSGMDAGLRSSGVAGTATVTSVAGTGVRINGEPVVQVGLEVDVVSHAPYSVTVRQRLPLFWGPLAPGSVVGVVVDPTNRDHLAIDWDAPASGSPAGAPVSEIVVPGPSVVDAEELIRSGRHAKAMIISMADAGDMSELGLIEVGMPGEDDRMFIVDMEVQEAGLDPYEVRLMHRVPQRLLGKVGPRTRVRVAIDRADDHVVAIDWSSVGG